MKVCGITAEFNPFHNGHLRLIKKARESGFTHVIAVMSGNFVQRGEPAIFETEKRAEAAVRCGADLVIQLPVTFALSGAERFARGAVGLLNSTGIADSLVFGSECGETDMLRECSGIIDSEEMNRLIKLELTAGVSYARAREKAFEAISPSLAGVIREPNNILAVEYLRALRYLDSDMGAFTVSRNIPHDSEALSDGYASASAIRKMIKTGEDFSRFVPDVYEKNSPLNIVDSNRFEASVLCIMRKMKREEFAALPDISEGIENRIYSASRVTSSLDELYSLAKTKRYSHARIRRIVMSAFIGINASDSSLEPGYIRPLALNDRGAELTALMKGKASLPLISRTSDVSKLPAQSQRLFSLECSATDLYGACLTDPLRAGFEKDRKIKKIVK